MSTYILNLCRLHPTLKKAEIIGLLYLLREKTVVDNNHLVRTTGLPKEELRKFKSNIAGLLEETTDETINLSKEGEKALLDLPLKPYNWTLLKYSNLDLETTLKKIRKDYGLNPKREFDQWFCTEQSTVAKMSILLDKDCVEDKRILLLGDDDLLSVALGLSTDTYNKLTVADIDDSLLDTLNTIYKDRKLKNVQTIKYDVRKAITNDLANKFDVIVIDPPYTKTGLTIFLNRAVESLNGEGKYIFLYFGNSFKSPEKYLKVQEILNKFNLVVEDKIDKFCEYYGAESIGSRSSLYILRTTPFTKPLKEVEGRTKIYTYDTDYEDKFPYVDHVVIKVNEVPRTILTNKSTLLSLLGKFCLEHKLTVVDKVVTKFKNEGLSVTFILSNSNLVAHTWPENSALHLDLITCKPIFKKDFIADTIRTLFKTERIEVSIIE